MGVMSRLALVSLAISSLFLVQRQTLQPSPLLQAMNQVSENRLRANLSFLSSDALEGRGTPSRGLDVAAEFIASRFREAGLTPIGDNGYFQTGEVSVRGQSEKGHAYNVVGMLKGVDPKLNDTYILVTAHYDHLGMRTQGEGDLIYNGANDDGSGTVGVIELSQAMSKLKPKRSIIFMTYFGEERGGLGSRWYANHPLVPIAKTIANINLEQIGRTDDSEGKRVDELSMTGYDYSNLGEMMNSVSKEVGIKITKHPVNSDAFFFRSDNATLAGYGVPAHTVCTAFVYPDYHALSDTWDKVDYANEARILRGLLAALNSIASSDVEPKWNADNPKAARYYEAWKKTHGG